MEIEKAMAVLEEGTHNGGLALAAIRAVAGSESPLAESRLLHFFSVEDNVAALEVPTIDTAWRPKAGQRLPVALVAIAESKAPFAEEFLVEKLTALPTFGPFRGPGDYGRNLRRVRAIGHLRRPTERTYSLLNDLMALPKNVDDLPKPKPYLKANFPLVALTEEEDDCSLAALTDIRRNTSSHQYRAIESLARIGTDRARDLLWRELRRRYDRYGRTGMSGRAAGIMIIACFQRFRDRPAIFELLVDAARAYGDLSPWIIETILTEEREFRLRDFSGHAPPGAVKYASVRREDAGRYVAAIDKLVGDPGNQVLTQASLDRLREIRALMVQKDSELRKQADARIEGADEPVGGPPARAGEEGGGDVEDGPEGLAPVQSHP